MIGQINKKNIKLTLIFISINLLYFFFVASQMFLSSGTTTNILIKFGALSNLKVYSGEYWRLITAPFIHIDFIHLALNLVGLFILGTIIEGKVANYKYIIVFILSAIMASISSLLFSQTVSIGASGIVFGLFGFTLGIQLIKYNSLKTFFSNKLNIFLVIFLVINIFMGLVPNSQIDNFAHFGGLITGLALAYFFFAKTIYSHTKVIIIKAVVIFLGILLITYSVYPFQDPYYYLSKAITYFDTNKTEKAETQVSKSLELAKGDLRLRYKLSTIYINYNLYEKALDQLLFLENFTKYSNAVVPIIAKIYRQTRRFEKAVEYYNTMVRNSIYIYEAYFYKAYSLNKANKTDEALTTISEVEEKINSIEKSQNPGGIILNPNSRFVKYYKQNLLSLRIEIYQKTNQEEKYSKALSELINEYENELKTNPSANVKNNLAYVCAVHEKQLDKALELSRETLRNTNISNEEKIMYKDTLGWIYYKLERYEEAEEIFSDVIQDTDDRIFLYHYGKVLLAMGQEQEAIEYLHKSIKDNIDFERYEEAEKLYKDLTES